VRALEERNFERAVHVSSCFPRLSACGKMASQNCMSLCESAMGVHILAVGVLVVELASENINEDLKDLQNSVQESEEGENRISKDSIMRKLKRLSPGEASNITCIIDDAGEHHTSPQEMAQTLCDHWKEVFGPSGCNEGLLREWCSKLFPEVSPGIWDTKLLHGRHEK